MVRITNKPTQTTLAEKFLQRTLNSLLVILGRLRLILTLITLLSLLRLLGLLFLCELLGSLQDVEEVTAGLCIPVSILLLLSSVHSNARMGLIGGLTHRHGNPSSG